MRNLRSRTHAISGAFVFLLLGLFAVFALLMVLLSAQLYRVTVTAGDEHNEQRVPISYLINTVHAADQAGAVSVEEKDGIPMLVMTWPKDSEQPEASFDEEEDTLVQSFGIPDEDSSDDMEEEETDDDAGYQTLVYCYEGNLYELLLSGGSDYAPEDGEAICAMSAFTPSLSGQSLHIDFTDSDGQAHSFTIHLYCTAEGGAEE